MRQDKFQTDMLPNIFIDKVLKQSVKRMEEYEGLLKPTPIKIELRGQLPPFDVDKELNFDYPKLGILQCYRRVHKTWEGSP